jgi:hypothetical protein
MRTLTIAGIVVFLSCTSDPSQQAGSIFHSADADAGTSEAQRGSTRYKEGTDYHILQRVRLMDENGFGRPAEAASFLLPKGGSSLHERECGRAMVGHFTGWHDGTARLSST